MHAQVDAVLAAALRERGAQVAVVTCDGLFKRCYAIGDSNNPDRDCANCAAKGQHLFEAFELPIIQLRDLIKDGELENLHEKVHGLSASELELFEYNGMPHGCFMMGPVSGHFRATREQLNEPRILEVYQLYTAYSMLVYDAMSRLFDEYKPTGICIYNGHSFHHRSVLELSIKRNLPVVTHERGAHDKSFMFGSNNPSAHTSGFLEVYDNWKDVPLGREELERVREYYDKRERGEDTNYHSYYNYSTSHAQLRERLNIPRDAKVLSVFTSSEYEFSYYGAEFPMMREQTSILERLIELFRNREEYLVIRHHPSFGIAPTGAQPQFTVLDRLYKQAERASSNVRIIMPDEQTTSYALIWNSEACIAFISSVRLEAAARGVPVATCDHPFLENGATYLIKDTSSTGLNSLVSNLFSAGESIDIEYLRRLYRTTQAYFFRHSFCLNSVEIKNNFEPNIKISSYAELAPGRDPHLDRICSHMLEGTSLFESPTEAQKALPIEIENDFLKEELIKIKDYRKEVRLSSASSSEPTQKPHFYIILYRNSSMPSQGRLAQSLRRQRQQNFREHTLVEHVANKTRQTLDQLYRAVANTQEGLILLGADCFFYDECLLSESEEIFAKSPGISGVSWGAWLKVDEQGIVDSLLTSRDSEESYTALFEKAAIFSDPLLMLSLCVWKKDALLSLLSVAKTITEDELDNFLFSAITGKTVSRTKRAMIVIEDSSTKASQHKNSTRAVKSIANDNLKFLQIHLFYQDYLNDLYRRNPELTSYSFSQQIEGIISDGFSGSHLFAPYMTQYNYEAQLVIANAGAAQHRWMEEQNLSIQNTDNWLFEILLAQIEYYKPDVLYLTDPIHFDSKFVRSLTHRPDFIFGWRAAEVWETTDWSEFDLILSHLSVCRDKAIELGARKATFFCPGFTPDVYEQVSDVEEQYDIVFSGQWSSAHSKRNSFLHHVARAVSSGRRNYNIGFFLPSAPQLPIPAEVARFNFGPRWGLEMYRTLRKGRIVLNGEIDLAGNEAGNMRLFETTGVGGFALTEFHPNLGQYFKPGVEVESFQTETELLEKIDHFLSQKAERKKIAKSGFERCHKDHLISDRAQLLDRIIRTNYAEKKAKQDNTRRTRPTVGSQKTQSPNSVQVEELMDKALEKLSRENTKTALEFVIKAKCLQIPTRNLDYLRAMCFVKLEQLGDAREALQEELRHFGDNKEARELLNQILEEEQKIGEHSSISDTEFLELLKVLRPYSMLPECRLYNLFVLTKKVCLEDIPGDIVECGVAGGGSTAMIATLVKRYSKRARMVYACDSFEGMPRPSEHDSIEGTPADATGWGTGTCAAPEQSVLEICTKLGVESLVKTVKGYFENTLPTLRQEVPQIALLHVDCDWYESALAVFENLYDNMSSGTFIQIDDYGYWDGMKRAVDEFTARRNVSLAINPLQGGAWCVRP